MIIVYLNHCDEFWSKFFITVSLRTPTSLTAWLGAQYLYRHISRAIGNQVWDLDLSNSYLLVWIFYFRHLHCYLLSSLLVYDRHVRQLTFRKAHLVRQLVYGTHHRSDNSKLNYCISGWKILPNLNSPTYHLSDNVLTLAHFNHFNPIVWWNLENSAHLRQPIHMTSHLSNNSKLNYCISGWKNCCYEFVPNFRHFGPSILRKTWCQQNKGIFCFLS